MYLVRNNNNKSLFDEMNSFFGLSKIREMKTDIEENSNEYKLSIEIPGFNKDEINITYDDGYLTVFASKSEEKEDKKEYVRKERYSSSIQRTYYLNDVDEESITAKLENGVLNISLQKLQVLPENTKRIAIE